MIGRNDSGVQEVGSRFLIYWLLRKDELCPGEASCKDVIETRDEQGDLTGRERCGACPLTGFEASMGGQAGQILGRVADIDASLEWGFRMDLDDISCEEFHLLKVLRSERNRLEAKRQQNPES